MIHRSTPAVRVLCLAMAFVAIPALAGAASKVKIAALGDEAPGGGVFAGPSFTAAPTAAGNGWIAFRSLVTGSGSAEQIVVQNVTTGERHTAATLGQEITTRIGTFKQFLGRPTVNGNGDVAFVAVVTPPDDSKPRPTDPTPAGVFLFKRPVPGSPASLEIVARPGLETDLGTLDLTTPVDVLAGLTAVDIPERTPALNDRGDVAFVSSTSDGLSFSGAIFLRPAGGEVAPMVRIGDAYDGGRFAVLGPPAMNNAGTMAFRGLTDGGALLDGVFRLDASGLTLLVASGFKVHTDEFDVDQELVDFGTTLSINDLGDVAFTAGPLFDLSFGAIDTDDEDIEQPGVLVYHAGMVFLVSYPGKSVASRGRVTSHKLAPEFGAQVVPPSLGPDGTVMFLAELNGGSSQVLFQASQGTYAVNDIVLNFGGAFADPTPIGGTYLQASSAIALDATLGVAFFARMAGSTSAEALIYRPSSGNGASVRIGDAVPGGRTDGFFGGPPFFPPRLTDSGDVIFKAYIARGAGLGIFRARGDELQAIVRLGDIAPVEGAPAITNLVGDPSVNAAGDIAFAAVAPIIEPLIGDIVSRPFIAIAGPTGLRKVVAPFDPFFDVEREGAEFIRIAPHPTLNDAGAVAFRATIEYPDPIFPLDFPPIRENGVFLADGSGIRALVLKGDRSPAGPAFFKFFEPTVSGSGPIAFRATLGSDGDSGSGFFLADASGVASLGVSGDELPDGRRLTSMRGRAALDQNGGAVFLARTTAVGEQVATIVRRTASGLAPIVTSGDAGPAGGLFRSLGRPSVTASGMAVFRANFEPFTGGVAGIFRADQAGIRPYVQIGEGAASALGGRIVGFNQNVSVNRDGNLAFIASVGGGTSRNALFLASPATLATSKVGFTLGPPLDLDDLEFTPKDRIALQVTLTPGGIAGEVRPAQDAVAVSLSDTKGVIWSATLPAGSLQGKGSRFSLKPSARTAIKRLKVRVKKGVIRARIQSAPFDVLSTITGIREFFEDAPPEIVPPFTVRFELGDDNATVTVPCTRKRRRFSCGG